MDKSKQLLDKLKQRFNSWRSSKETKTKRVATTKKKAVKKNQAKNSKKQTSRFLVISDNFISFTKETANFMICSYSEIFFLVGIMINSFLILVHNITMTSIYLSLFLFKLLLSLKIDKKKIGISADWLKFDKKRVEDIILVIYPFLPALYYSDKDIIAMLLLFWTLFILSFDKACYSKKIIAYISKTISETR